MPTPNERKGLLFLALVALSGSGVRVWRARTPPLPRAETTALDRQLGTVDSIRAAKRVAKGRPKATARASNAPSTAVTDPAPVELNAATAAEIEALPGIGPALAKRVVAHRDSAGPFADLRALCDVRGIGPALAQRLRPLVTFHGRASPVSDACDTPSTGPRKARAQRGRKAP